MRFIPENWWGLDKLPSTNFKIAVGAILSILTAIFYFASEMRCTLVDNSSPCRPIDSVNFGMWLGFVAAWAAITTYQFKVKRDTYEAPSPDSERAGVAEPTLKPLQWQGENPDKGAI